MKYLLLLSLVFLKINTAYSQELKININEFETKEQLARSLNLNAQQVEIFPKEVQYIKSKSLNNYGIQKN